MLFVFMHLLAYTKSLKYTVKVHAVTKLSLSAIPRNKFL